MTKKYKVLIPKSVEEKLIEQFNYIAFDQLEPQNALKWLKDIKVAINSLERFPKRCPLAPESTYFRSSSEIRHLIHKKFRIIFATTKNEIKVLTIKHGAQIN